MLKVVCVVVVSMRAVALLLGVKHAKKSAYWVLVVAYFLWKSGRCAKNHSDSGSALMYWSRVVRITIVF